MVIDLVAFQHLVETFKDERPEAVHGSIIEDLFDDVSYVMEIWFDLVAMQLGNILERV